MNSLSKLTPADMMALLQFIQTVREGFDDDEIEEQERAEEYLMKAQKKIFNELSEMVIKIANEEQPDINDIINPN
jgi:hypothetical protein